MRIEGTTYPDDDRAPRGSRLLFGHGRSLREFVARVVVGASLQLLRPRPGDVLVVVGGDRLSSQWRRGVVYAARAAGLHTAVFLPRRVRVYVEPSRLRTEDRGYQASKDGKATQEPDNGSNQDRGVWVGTPDSLPS